MKKVRQSYIRWSILGLLLAFVLFASISSEIGEWYALELYPGISKFLSAISSLVSFSLDEWTVVGGLFLLVTYPFYARLKRKRKWLSILGGEMEILLWVYVWFYWGWGMNYYRTSFFQRAEVTPAKYNEASFHDFLSEYTDSLRISFDECKKEGVFNVADLFAPYSSLLRSEGEQKGRELSMDSKGLEEVDLYPEVKGGFDVSIIQDKIKDAFCRVPVKYGLTLPEDYQFPKCSSFNSLYSSVGVLGFMGPFFAESHVNHELSILEYPFTYAHELSHLLGVSSEAEANLWAYLVCTQTSDKLIRFCGYYGLFSYIWSNSRYLLTSADFDKWEASIPSEIMAAFYRNHTYWSLRHNKILGQMQSSLYSFYLKKNRISSGMKNYGQVVGLLLSLPNYKIELRKE